MHAEKVPYCIRKLEKKWLPRYLLFLRWCCDWKACSWKFCLFIYFLVFAFLKWGCGWIWMAGMSFGIIFFWREIWVLLWKHTVFAAHCPNDSIFGNLSSGSNSGWTRRFIYKDIYYCIVYSSRKLKATKTALKCLTRNNEIFWKI